MTLLIVALACAAVLLGCTVELARRLSAALGELRQHAADLERGGARAAIASGAEQRFRGIVEAADDIIFRTNADGCFVYVNPAVPEMLGYSEAELRGRAFLDLVREDYREQARRFYEDQRAQGMPNTYCEFPMRTRDGRDVWVGQRAQLVVEDGRFAGLQALARDITERKLLQQTVEREREQLRQIVSHAPVAMAMLDRGRPPHRPQRPLAALPGGRRPLARRPHARRGLARACPRATSEVFRARARGRGRHGTRGRDRARGRQPRVPALDRAPLARRPGCHRGRRARRAEHRAAGARAAGGARGFAPEVRVRGQHEPRDPDADERRHRHDAPAARHAAHARTSASTPRSSTSPAGRCSK